MLFPYIKSKKEDLTKEGLKILSEYIKKEGKMCDETSKEIKKELKQDDKKHGGGPETDREKDRRDKFAKLYGSDRGKQNQDDNEQDQEDNEPERDNREEQDQSNDRNSEDKQ